MKKKGIIIGVVAIVLICAGIGGWYLLKDKGGDSSSDEVAYVQSVGSITGANGFGAQNRYSGVVEAQETWDVQFNSEKKVKELLVEEGQEVEVGTALFTYDTEQMQASLDQSALDLERIDNSIAELTQNIAQLEKDKKAAAKDDQFEITVQIQTAQMDIKTKEYEKKAKDVEIEQTKKSIENSTVYSEMAGVVKSINKDNSTDMYGQTAPYISILSTGDYRIKGKINEQNISALYEGVPVIIYSRVDDTQHWRGILNKIDTEKIDTDSSNNSYYSAMDSGSTTNSYPFYIDAESTDGLMLGQHVFIELDLGQTEEREGIWLDANFIVMEDDNPKNAYVWAADGDKLIKKSVTLGEFDEALYQYEIADGLILTDLISTPQAYYKVGMNAVVGEMGILDDTMMDEEGDVINADDMGGFEDDKMIPEDDGATVGGEVINGELDMSADTPNSSETEGGQ